MPAEAERRAPVHLSWTSPFVGLSILVTCGFFAVLFTMLFGTDVNPSMKDPLMLMLGALMSAFTGIIGWFYGSSSTSAGKDAAISDLTKTAAAVASTAQATQVAADVAAAQPTKAGEVAIEADSVTVSTPKGATP
jgi:drug/metabolite transporter (DMT)-like permease